MSNHRNIVTLIIDGYCKEPNSLGSYAAYFVQGVHTSELAGWHENTTQQRMELTAAVEAIRNIKSKTGYELEIFTDSIYVTDGIQKWVDKWIRNGWRTKEKKTVSNKDLWEELIVLTADKTIRWKSLRKKEQNPGNKYCSELARRVYYTKQEVKGEFNVI